LIYFYNSAVEDYNPPDIKDLIWLLVLPVTKISVFYLTEKQKSLYFTRPFKKNYL